MWSGTAAQLGNLKKFIADMDYLTRHATWFFKYHMLHPRGTPDEAEIPDTDFFRTLLCLMNNFGGKNEYSPSNEKFKDIVDELTPQLVRYQDIADFWPPEIPAAQAANAINYAAAMMLTNVTVAVKMNLAKRILEYVGVMMRARRSELIIKCLHRKDTPAGLKVAIRRFRAKVRLIEKLAVDPEQALDDPLYFHGKLSSADITILESVWEILPECAFHLLMRNSHMVYDIELHPELYFESYVKLGMMMDAARLRGLDA
ncbi:hypothetical protein HDU86_005573 [Geranomyces michiganensis]|nr:hypothetical protein HDU86_005573 [Geranomyces michiganensis]